MRESWHYYDYLRRWWRLLVLALILGGLTGFGYYLRQDHPPRFEARALLRVPGRLELWVVSKDNPTEEAAVEAMATIRNTLGRVTASRVNMRDLSIHGRNQANWWKPTVMGIVFGEMFAIAFIYLWEDVRRYERHRRQIGPPDE